MLSTYQKSFFKVEAIKFKKFPKSTSKKKKVDWIEQKSDFFLIFFIFIFISVNEKKQNMRFPLKSHFFSNNGSLNFWNFSSKHKPGKLLLCAIHKARQDWFEIEEGRSFERHCLKIYLCHFLCQAFRIQIES